MHEDTPVFQKLDGGGPHHTSGINGFVRAMMAERDPEEAEAAEGGGQEGAVSVNFRGACHKDTGDEVCGEH